MKTTHTVAIVGAGIAGITAAYFEALKGHQVYLIESAHRAGGLLQSDVTPFGSFDYGTHVGTFCGVETLDDFLFGGMGKENFNFFNPGLAGNYYSDTLSEISPFVDTSLMTEPLTHQAEEELLNPEKGMSANHLEDLMIARFGPTIYREVLSGVVQKFMGCSAASLSGEIINFFDMNRILAFDSDTSDRLKMDERFNAALGYHYPLPGAQKIYPRVGGMGYWVEFLMKKLEKTGVHYLPNTKIQGITSQGDQVSQIDIGEQSLSVDQLIWSIPPALFSRFVPSAASFPMPKFRKTALYDFSFVKPLSSKCFYINVYDTSKLSGRITLYPNLTSDCDYHTCTVEVLEADDFDFENATGQILEELRSIGIVDEKNPCVYQVMRAVNNGFPLPELNYLQQTIDQSNKLNAAFSNVFFIGRAPGRFFMKDVLKHTYQKVWVDRVGVQ